MKKIITLMSAVLVLGAVATASTTVNSKIEISVQKSILENNPTTVLGHCDPIERLLGMCRSSQTLPFEN